MIKGSRLYHFTDEVLKPKKKKDLIEQYKSLIQESVSLAQFKKSNHNSADIDIGFYAFILKLVSQKNPVSGEQEVWKILALTHE